MMNRQAELSWKKSFRKVMRKILLTLSIVLWVTSSFAQTKPLTDLTVEEIMQSQSKFVGTPPSRVSWSKDSKTIFFNWNPDIKTHIKHTFW